MPIYKRHYRVSTIGSIHSTRPFVFRDYSHRSVELVSQQSFPDMILKNCRINREIEVPLCVESGLGSMGVVNAGTCEGGWFSECWWRWLCVAAAAIALGHVEPLHSSPVVIQWKSDRSDCLVYP